MSISHFQFIHIWMYKGWLLRALRLTHWGRDKNGRYFSDDIFKCIFLNENTSISIDISLKFVPEGRINNIQALVQIMAWRRLGDKPLSEPTSTIRTPTFWEYPRSLPMNKFQTRSPIKELGGDLDPRYVPAKFDHDRRRIAPRRVVTGLAGQNDYLAR